jgi:hypothetical protein
MGMARFLDHVYAQELLSLEMPPDHFAIAGSGPLFVRGWIDDIIDLDVVARGPAWDIAATLASPEPAPYSAVRRVRLFHGDIEILDGWFPEYWKLADLIDGAEVMYGIRFVQLDIILRTKQLLNRPRDLDHLDLLRKISRPESPGGIEPY